MAKLNNAKVKELQNAMRALGEKLDRGMSLPSHRGYSWEASVSIAAATPS